MQQQYIYPSKVLFYMKTNPLQTVNLGHKTKHFKTKKYMKHFSAEIFLFWTVASLYLIPFF